MNKVVAIFLLTIQLFNLTGYSIFFEYLADANDRQTVQQLDNGNYDREDLIEIKIPVQLPYYNESDFERYDGEIEVGGIDYNFVMRRIFADTLYLFCLPNYAKTDLYKARDDYAANAVSNDLSTPGKKAAESPAKKNLSLHEYCRQLQPAQFAPVPACAAVHENIFASPLTYCYIASPSKPPESAADFL